MNEEIQYKFLRGLATAAADTAAAADVAVDEPPPWLSHAASFEDTPPSVNPYTTTGFIVWYCFLFLCCGVPMLCCCISICCLAICKRCNPSEDGDDAVSADRRSSNGQVDNDLELEIARIEANIHAFSLKEQQCRRSNLAKALTHHKMVSNPFS